MSRKPTDKKEYTKSLLRDQELYSYREKQKAIETVLMGGLVHNMGRGKPGEVVNAMSKETLAALAQCTDKDWNHRMPEWMEDKSWEAQIRKYRRR